MKLLRVRVGALKPVQGLGRDIYVYTHAHTPSYVHKGHSRVSKGLTRCLRAAPAKKLLVDQANRLRKINPSPGKVARIRF